jgi:PDZ domain-containing protein
VALRLRRAGTLLTRAVTTVPDPREPGRPIVGIAISQEAAIVLPFPVEIGLGDVGGPSAGLPFALEVLQKLGNDVDRGYRVAATGELELDGSVQPVGGLKQKTIGVRSAGVDVFLVPAGENATVARRYAGNLRIIPVESFQQALRALQTLPAR